VTGKSFWLKSTQKPCTTEPSTIGNCDHSWEVFAISDIVVDDEQGGYKVMLETTAVML